MLYLANASSSQVRDAMSTGLIGMLATPNERRAPDLAAVWAADNGCFSEHYVGDPAWLAWLERHAAHAGRALFATAPDVFDRDLGRGDPAATLERSRPFLPRIRAMGYPAAYVAQDGCEDHRIPWGEFDVLFIGGGDDWKLGRTGSLVDVIAEAHARRVPVHMGRVNSRRRWSYAQHLGCGSVDGGYLRWPDENLPRLLSWMAQGALFDGAAS